MVLAAQSRPASSGPAETRPAAAKPILHIRCEERVYKFGEQPAFRVAWSNPTKEGVEVILPLDGSAEGMRMPSYRWVVKSEVGEELPPHIVGRCGNVNGIQSSDWLRLEPGARVELGDVSLGWLGSPWPRFGPGFPMPGKFRVQLVYRFARGSGPGQLFELSKPSERDRKRWFATPELEVASNEAMVEIGPPTERDRKRMAAMAAIRVGDAGARVRELLGEPEELSPYHETHKNWGYRLLDAPRDPMGWMRFTVAVSDAGKVTEVANPFREL
ncbi:MAG: hypothetical protein JNJ88_12730 [Planctomycetes bacterium]|nr:hypothetical protein [Planctomycetota bacterium]